MAVLSKNIIGIKKMDITKLKTRKRFRSARKTTNVASLTDVVSDLEGITTELNTAVKVTSTPLEIGNFPTSNTPINGPSTYRRPTIIRRNHSHVNVQTSTGGTNIAQCIALPSQFDAVQIGIPLLGGSGAMVGFKLAVASTDDVGDLSMSNTAAGKKWITPKKLGVTNNAYQYGGWAAVNWAGSATLGLADPGNGNTAFAFSDFTQIEGLEESSRPGVYPLLVRGNMGTGAYSLAGPITGFGSAVAATEAGKDFWVGANRSAGNDAVGDVTLWTDASTPTFGDAFQLPLIILAYTAKRYRNWMLIGDSRFASAAISETATAQGYRGQGFRTQKALLAAGKKCSFVHAAMSGLTTAQYHARAMTALAYVAPDVAVYLVNSINNGGPTAANVSLCRAKCLQFLDQCAKIGTQPVLVTQYPYTGGYGDDWANVVALEAWCRSFGVPVISPIDLYSDKNTGEWASAAWHEDSAHGTPALQDDFAGRLALALDPFL